MQAAAGKKTFVGAGRIRAVEGGIEQVGKGFIRRLNQVVDGPTADAVLVGDVDFFFSAAGVSVP